MEKIYKEKVIALENELSKVKSQNLMLYNEINSLKAKENQLILEKNSINKEIISNLPLLQSLREKEAEILKLKDKNEKLQEKNEKLEEKVEKLEEKLKDIDKLSKNVKKLNEELETEKKKNQILPDFNQKLFIMSNQNIIQKRQFYKKIQELQTKLNFINEKKMQKPSNLDYLIEINESLLLKNNEKAGKIENLLKRNEELERNNRQFIQINPPISNKNEERKDNFDMMIEAVSEEVILHEEN